MKTTKKITYNQKKKWDVDTKNVPNVSGERWMMGTSTNVFILVFHMNVTVVDTRTHGKHAKSKAVKTPTDVHTNHQNHTALSGKLKNNEKNLRCKPETRLKL